VTAVLSLVPAPTELAELDHLEQAVDSGLAAAIDALAELRARDAHLARGHDTWGGYLVARFGDALRRLRLDRTDHLAVVDYLARPHGDRGKAMPVRQIAEVLAVSSGTAQTYRRELGLAPAAPSKPTPQPAPTGRVFEQAAAWLGRAERGLTLIELAKVAGWSEGKASGALSFLTAPARGLAVRTDDRRLGQRVHHLTDAGRALLAAADA
jgi:hypothetical protein